MFLNKLMFLPVLAQVLLTFGLARLLGRARVAAVGSGKVRMADVAIDKTRWPDEARKLANAYQNQFEQPVLFYAATVLFIAFDAADYAALSLAILYVALRYVHAFIHAGSNHVPSRFRVFAASMGTLAVFWAWLVYRVVMA